MMSYYLVIDTETSGLMDFSRPADAPHQGRLAEFAMIRLDHEGRYLARYRTYIHPDGWAMTTGATRLNGLTNAFLQKHGQPVGPLLSAWGTEVAAGDVSIVGYNVRFDLKVMRGELRRAGQSDYYRQTTSVDLMRIMTPICRIPGRRGWKWPTLTEACVYYGIPLRHAHGAAWDALATARLFRRLRKEGRV